MEDEIQIIDHVKKERLNITTTRSRPKNKHVSCIEILNTEEPEHHRSPFSDATTTNTEDTNLILAKAIIDLPSKPLKKFKRELEKFRSLGMDEEISYDELVKGIEKANRRVADGYRILENLSLQKEENLQKQKRCQEEINHLRSKVP